MFFKKLDLVKNGEKYNLLVKVTDQVVLTIELDALELEALISKFRQFK